MNLNNMKLPWDKMEPTCGELEYTIKSYPDGTKYVTIDALNDYHLTFRLSDYNDLWVLSQINDALKHMQAYVVLTIPNLLDAQADRRFADNQPSGLKLVCQFLNDLKQFNRINIFHPHNPEVVEALIDNVRIIDNTDFVYEVLSDIKGLPKYDNNSDDLEANLVLMSSDAGGFKPLIKLADKLEWKGETYGASKSRDPKTHRLTQQIDRQDFGGKDILIVDDINVYGGTFKGLSNILRQRNCGDLYLAVSHMTVQNLGDDAVTNYFDMMYTTNSKFERYWDNTDRGFSIRDRLKVIKMF